MVQSWFHLPRPTALTSMIVPLLPAAAVEKQQFHYGSGWTAVRYESKFTECSHSDEVGPPSTDDAAQFGINLKDTGQHQHCMSTLIEKR